MRRSVFRSNKSDNEKAAEALHNRTKELVTAAHSFKDASGEYKRHRVYAQLIKEFPIVEHRDIGHLIELVLQEEKKNV